MDVCAGNTGTSGMSCELEVSKQNNYGYIMNKYNTIVGYIMVPKGMVILKMGILWVYYE